MRNWIQSTDEGGLIEGKQKRVAVVHCKAGKGRSGTSACSYLISQEGWKMEDALQRFTQRRMRVGFGNGVSIPSQLRWVNYVNRWTNELQKKYVERPVEILEVHVYGLRDGVKVAVEGYVEDGRRIEIFHTFTRHEKTIVHEGPAGAATDTPSTYSSAYPSHDQKPSPLIKRFSPNLANDRNSEKETLISPIEASSSTSSMTSLNMSSNFFSGTVQTVLLKPTKPIILPTSDINIDFERRSQASTYTGLTMVTSIAHVWFNAYFEGGHVHDSGVFEIDWEKMDGIKGSARKGTKALERLKVVWRYASASVTESTITGGATTSTAQTNFTAHLDTLSTPDLGRVITEPSPGEEVPEGKAADWRGASADPDRSKAEKEAKKSDGVDSGRHGAALLTMGSMIKQGAGSLSKELGLRPSDPGSVDVSRAPSVKPHEQEEDPQSDNAEQQTELRSKPIQEQEEEAEDDEYLGVRTHGPDGEDNIKLDSDLGSSMTDSAPTEKEQGQGEREGRQDTKAGRNLEIGLGKLASMISKMKGDDKDDAQ